MTETSWVRGKASTASRRIFGNTQPKGEVSLRKPIPELKVSPNRPHQSSNKQGKSNNQESPLCPECGSPKFFKTGVRKL